MYRELEESYIPASEWMEMVKPLIDEGYTLKICPSGLSMVPFIRGGRDQVFLRSASGIKLRRGDIVLYVRENGRHVLHRIHRIKDGEFFMLGDSQAWIEGPLKRHSIQAVATSFIRKGREIGCENAVYRALSAFWLILRPIRPIILGLRYKNLMF